MNDKHLKKIFFTRSEIVNAEKNICDNCFEHIVFLLHDNKGREFSLGLTTVLECLAFAIDSGNLPKLPVSWLSDVDHVYYTGFSEREGIFYND